ncbi:MAG: hypothetical protein H6708_26490 [Kofleriaceae bacterium]|nr:hypothetical protein [Kofleriaceae bacterium]
MTVDLSTTLVVAAVSVGSLHSLAPDHWLPIAAVGRAQGWSTSRTARIAALCGVGHVTVSLLLGLLGLLGGLTVAHGVGARSAQVSAILLIGFGTTYAAWGLRGALRRRLHDQAHARGHVHDHDHAHDAHHHRHHHAADPSRTTVWTLFLVYCADPCVAVIPILFAAAPLPRLATGGVVVAYEAATIGTMVILAAVARAGAGALRGAWIDRWVHSAAGASIVVTGVAVAVLGW